MSRTPLGRTLPDFPWNSLAGAKKKAQAHPDGIVDLSVGNPVDPVAPGVQLALSAAAEAPGYPQTQGTPELREAIAAALRSALQGRSGAAEAAIFGRPGFALRAAAVLRESALPHPPRKTFHDLPKESTS